MTCPTCPVTIKKALLKQPGVTAVVVRYEKKQLEVAFDDAKDKPNCHHEINGFGGFPVSACQMMRRSSDGCQYLSPKHFFNRIHLEFRCPQRG